MGFLFLNPLKTVGENENRSTYLVIQGYESKEEFIKDFHKIQRENPDKEMLEILEEMVAKTKQQIWLNLERDSYDDNLLFDEKVLRMKREQKGKNEIEIFQDIEKSQLYHELKKALAKTRKEHPDKNNLEILEEMAKNQLVSQPKPTPKFQIVDQIKFHPMTYKIRNKNASEQANQLLDLAIKNYKGEEAFIKAFYKIREENQDKGVLTILKEMAMKDKNSDLWMNLATRLHNNEKSLSEVLHDTRKKYPHKNPVEIFQEMAEPFIIDELEQILQQGVSEELRTSSQAFDELRKAFQLEQQKKDELRAETNKKLEAFKKEILESLSPENVKQYDLDLYDQTILKYKQTIPKNHRLWSEMHYFIYKDWDSRQAVKHPVVIKAIKKRILSMYLPSALSFRNTSAQTFLLMSIAGVASFSAIEILLSSLTQGVPSNNFIFSSPETGLIGGAITAYATHLKIVYDEYKSIVQDNLLHIRQSCMEVFK